MRLRPVSYDGLVHLFAVAQDLAQVSSSDVDDQIPLALALSMAAVLSAAGTLVAVMARRGIDGRLQRNRLAGIRTSATLASDEAWHEGQRVGGPLTMAGGVLMMVTAVPLLFRPSENVAGGTILVGVCVATGLVILGGIKGHRAAVRLTG